MRAAVAIGACGSRLPALSGAGVQTTVVCCLLLAVAGRTGDFGWHGLVGRSLDVGVTVNAGKHAAVYRGLELFRIDVQAHRPAIDFLGEAGVGVAG